MSHGLTEQDQVFSVRAPIWHAVLGTNSLVLQDYPTRVAAMEAAGLAWTVEETDVYRRSGRGFIEPVAGWKALYRSDTGDILHVSKDSYTIVDNVVGFEIAEALKSADEAVKYETGGSIKGGAVCFLTMKVDEPIVISGDNSETFPFVNVSWSHDGSGAIRAQNTDIRQVCQNTWKAAEAEGKRTGREFTFRHTKNVMARIDDAKRALAGAREESNAFVEIANELAGISISDETREKFITTFIPKPEADVISDRVLDNILKARKDVRDLFNGVTIPEAHRNTAYGLMLAGGEYLDHLRKAQNGDTYLGRTLLRAEPLKQKLVPQIRALVGAAS